MVYGDPTNLLLRGVMDSITDGQAILQKVVAKLGDAAASQLGVTQAAFARFLNGTEALPDGVLLRAMDIVLDEPQHIPSYRGEVRDPRT